MESKSFLLGMSLVLTGFSAFSQRDILKNTNLFTSQKTSFESTTVYNKKYTLPKTEYRMQFQSPGFKQAHKIELRMDTHDNTFFLNNRRNRYSALWAFTSLNYLYADLVGLMDKNILNQYQNGVVDGTAITPNFLTAAAGLMQIPLSNVFLPQVIKNERTLKWVQIASGVIMTLVQSGTLFLGTPTPYYMVFSAIEIGTTAYITFDAIKWKVPKHKIIE